MLDQGYEHAQNLTRPIYGKYQGTVENNEDPEGMGRLQAFVPGVLRGFHTGWAKPCVPYGGPNAGFFAVPPRKAGVWIEFEAGDVSQPIWTGCYWGRAELPRKPPEMASPIPGRDEWMKRIWRTDSGLTVIMDDKAHTITLSDRTAENTIEVNADTGIVTITGANQVVLHSPKIREGSIGASQRAVLGDNLVKYLGELVKIFNLHQHAVELALGIFPVTPAPTVTPMPMPVEPFLLSGKVKLE